MNFFDTHTTLTLLGLVFFPRITLLLANFVTGGVLWWLGWIFAPRLLIAILSLPFWSTNPFLVIVAWLLVFDSTGHGADMETRAFRKFSTRNNGKERP